ncbi:MAG: hypothetical protein DID90_2727554917 [Candidatus Nitrotoga sp. LAW]|jgi:hypothetical protein|nr:MAG: hypothetical protein DID90_2727554917 [Candidatus Nitrotoga sp. LAW]
MTVEELIERNERQEKYLTNKMLNFNHCMVQ